VYSPFNFDTTYTQWASATIGVTQQEAEEEDTGDGDFRPSPEGAISK